MAKKLEIIGNALVLTDTVTGDILAESPKRLVYYNVSRLNEESIVEIVNFDQMESTHESWPALEIGADLVDAGDAAYTLSSFRTFARTNLGS